MEICIAKRVERYSASTKLLVLYLRVPSSPQERVPNESYLAGLFVALWSSG